MSKNTKPSKRRPRSDSVGETIQIIQAKYQDILPPNHIKLREEDVPFWNSIISEYAKSEWTDHQLEIAAMLARNMYDLENTHSLMRKEGSIISVKNAEGHVINKKVNPRKQLMDMYIKNILSLRRSLALHARGKMGEPRDIARRRQSAKELENLFDDDEDGLLARPSKRIQ